MGLSERKQKQRIGKDPRNLTWSNDTDRFSYKHLSGMGWSMSKGLGSTFEGNPNHIAVIKKEDNGGIGMARARKENNDMAVGAGQAGREFEDVLKRLAAGSGQNTPAESASGSSTPVDKTAEEVKRSRSKIASRQKHLHSKRLASSSPAALAEILGVPLSSLPASPSPVVVSPSTPPPPTTVSLEPATLASPPSDTPSPSTLARTADETISTSTVSVADYFKQKMREKLRARNGLPQIAQTTTEASPAEPPQSSSATSSSSEWQGKRMTFDQDATDATPETAVDDLRAAKKARKETKRLKKLVDATPSSDPTPSSITHATDEVKKKKKRKEKMGEEGEESGKHRKKKRKPEAIQ